MRNYSLKKQMSQQEEEKKTRVLMPSFKNWKKFFKNKMEIHSKSNIEM